MLQRLCKQSKICYLRIIESWRAASNLTKFHCHMDTSLSCTHQMDVMPITFLAFPKLIGILLWAVELWRIDVQIKVALLLQYQSSPRESHIEALYLIFHFMSKKPKKRLAMYPSVPDVDEYVFNLNADWKEFYGGMVEKYSHQMPDPLGRPVYIGCFVDSYHGGNFITRRFHSVFF